MAERRLQVLAECYCPQYTTDAFFLLEQLGEGRRQLVVRYDAERYTGPDLPRADGSAAANYFEFSTIIPADWLTGDMDDLLLWPMKPGAPYPKWEVSARVHGSPKLFRFWAGEQPN
jgi:hypothetical protein